MRKPLDWFVAIVFAATLLALGFAVVRHYKEYNACLARDGVPVTTGRGIDITCFDKSVMR